MKKSIFARFTSVVLACAMALCVAASAVDAGAYTAALQDSSSNNHSSMLLANAETTVEVEDDVATVRVPLKTMNYMGMKGNVTSVTAAGYAAEYEAATDSVKDADGNKIVGYIVLEADAADNALVDGTGVVLDFKIDISGGLTGIVYHTKATVATLTLQ